MMKEQKGITLVALVITIIVLLILAGVSIAALGNSFPQYCVYGEETLIPNWANSETLYWRVIPCPTVGISPELQYTR